MKSDLYQKVTDDIVRALERGVRPWVKPWSSEHACDRITRPLRANGMTYSGINVLMLWSAAEDNGYSASTWMTFRQARAFDATVRKAERGTMVVYADKMMRSKTDEASGQEVEFAVPFLKSFIVFNVEQIDGLPAHFYSPETQRLNPAQRIAHAEAFFKSTKASVRHGGGMAYYHVKHDVVQMPPFESFRDADSYYSTLAHEITHWTRHAARLNREFGRQRFGDAAYAMEELVAELGAAFIGADLDLAPALREDHASYIANWLKVLKSDKRAIFTAAAHAQRASEYLQMLCGPAQTAGAASANT